MSSIKINERVYKLNVMRADEKAALGLDLLPVMAGPIGQLLRSPDLNISKMIAKFENKKEGSEDAPLELEDGELMQLVAVFIGLLPTLDMKVVWDLFYRALQTVNCIDGNLGDEPTRDIYFGQYAEDYYAVCIWALWENTKGFLLGSIPGLKDVFLGSAVAKSMSQSQKTGQSNGSSLQSTKPGSVPIPTLNRG